MRDEGERFHPFFVFTMPEFISILDRYKSEEVTLGMSGERPGKVEFFLLSPVGYS